MATVYRAIDVKHQRDLAISMQPNRRWSSIKALVFDVFGTVVDWRTSVAREVEHVAKEKGLTVRRSEVR